MVNTYKPGFGIVPHLDHPGYWGEWIVGFAIGSGATMELVNPTTNKTEIVYLPQRTLYFMKEDARYVCKHGITENPHLIMLMVLLLNEKNDMLLLSGASILEFFL